MAAKRRGKRPDEIRREREAEARKSGMEQGQDPSRVPGGKPGSTMRREEGQRPGEPRRDR